MKVSPPPPDDAPITQEVSADTPHRAAAGGHTAGLFRGPPAYRPLSTWHPAAALLATLGITIVAMVAGVVGAVLVKPSGGTGGEAAGWPFVAALAASQVSAILLTLYCARAYSGRVADVLALRPPAQGIAAYPLAFGLMLAMVGAYTAVVWFIDPSLLTHDLAAFAGLMQSEAWWLALAAIALGAPLMEELLFRGFLLSALARSRIGFAGGAVVTSAAWTMLHPSYSVAGLLEVFMVGIYFSWLLWRTGSLRVPMFCHALYNGSIAIFLLVHGLPSTGMAGGG